MNTLRAFGFDYPFKGVVAAVSYFFGKEIARSDGQKINKLVMQFLVFLFKSITLEFWPLPPLAVRLPAR